MNDRQRLEAIVSVVCKYLPPDGIPIKDAMSEIISIVDPLPPLPVQPEQEPSITKEARGTLILHLGWDDLPNGTKFYTTPQPRPWVGLTDEKVKEIWLKGKDHGDDWLDVLALARSFEAALKEKNR